MRLRQLPYIVPTLAAAWFLLAPARALQDSPRPPEPQAPGQAPSAEDPAGPDAQDRRLPPPQRFEVPGPDKGTAGPEDVPEGVEDSLDLGGLEGEPTPTEVPRPVARREPAEVFRYWTVVPPMVAILLAILTRQVVPSLVVAVIVGAYMLVFAPPAHLPAELAGAPRVIGGMRMAVEHYFLGALSDRGHVTIVVFTLLIGAMVGVIGANGGTLALVRSVSSWASTRPRGQIMGWLAGLVVFFDDYANSMIVGPTMRPIFDKLRISRQKLAYIVDSTAAPVASIALIGTWIGVEITYIGDGLNAFEHRPEFLADVTPYQAFLYSIPYRFYAILALFMVLLVAVSGRDFGPMKHAERRAAAGSAPEVAAERTAGATPIAKGWHAGVPVLALLFITMFLLFLSGWQGRPPDFGDGSILDKAGKLLQEAQGELAILYGAVAALFGATVITQLTRTLPLARTIEAAVGGMSRMFPAVVVLALAWSLSSVMQDLQLAEVAQNMLRNASFEASFLPLAIFLVSAVVSFATGSSWGTMGILCPVVVAVAGGLIAEVPDLPPDQALRLFYGSVGAVLAGSVFGDHCSPISDTTVLSATASGCSLESHVWTQLSYAVVTAAVAIVCGDVLCMHYGKPAWMGLLAGIATLGLIVGLFGRRTTVPSPAALSE